MTKLCKESHLHKINKKMGSVVLAERANRSRLDGLNVLLLVPRAVAHSTLDPTVTL